MRYIGNKTKLLETIDKFIKSNGVDITDKTLCDLFTGSATVADYFKDRCHIIANDSLYFSYAVAVGKLRYNKSFFKKLCFDPFEYFNTYDSTNYVSGFCYNTFAPTVSGRQYFSDANAKKIDYIRDTIDKWYSCAKINDDEKLYLIGCLIESASKVSNVAGVYSAYLKIWDPRAVKEMKFIPLETATESKFKDNKVLLGDVTDNISHLSGDILYLDPPYTPTQYISQYHTLETIARNDKPEVHGVGAHRNNGNQISRWCKKGVVHYEFEKLIKLANFKYIVFSYSDAGIMSKEYIEAVMKRYAKPGTYKFKKMAFCKYKNTRAINKETRENTKIKNHYEWLFFIEKEDDEKIKYQSPLNYIGGKNDLIDFLSKNMPEKNDGTFYDLFGGGFNVGLNAKSNNVVYNDLNYIVKELLEYLRDETFINIYSYIVRQIKKYDLSKSNKEAYIMLRKHYNSSKKKNPLDLYLLMCYGFEHQLRFNQKHEFNNPCGNSSFNDEMLEKLIQYHIRSNEIKCSFKTKSYSDFLCEISAEDFVYLDPPYLISCGAYNDGKRGFNGWDEQQEKKLFSFISKLNDMGIKFMLSNMADRNGETNPILQKWLDDNSFSVIYDTKITKRNRQDRKEIIVINYSAGEVN